MKTFKQYILEIKIDKNKISEYLFILNKLAKAYNGRHNYIVKRPINYDIVNKYYDLKDKIVKKYGKSTNIYHDLPTFYYGQLYKLGKHEFHIPIQIEDMLPKILSNKLKKDKKQLEKELECKIKFERYNTIEKPRDYKDKVSFVLFKNNKQIKLSDIKAPKETKNKYFEFQYNVDNFTRDFYNNSQFIKEVPQNLDKDISIEEEKEIVKYLESLI